MNTIDRICPLLKEVRVRYIGFGAEEDEWVNIKKAVRERSIALEDSDCPRLKVGDHVLCLQVILRAFLVELSTRIFLQCLFLPPYLW